MADHTITLTDEQEMALEVLRVQWYATRLARPLTTADALAHLLTTALDATCRDIEETLTLLGTVAAKLPAPMRARMLQGLSAAQQGQLSHLLPRAAADEGRATPAEDRPLRREGGPL